MYRSGIIPTLNGLQYETIFKHEKNLKRAKGSDIVLVKIKTFYIDGSALEEEKEAKINLDNPTHDLEIFSESFPTIPDVFLKNILDFTY